MLLKDRFNIDGHKMQYHPERTAQWLSAKTIEEKAQVFPIYVEISPSGGCNHRCTFCAVDYIGYKPGFISPLAMFTVLNDMGAWGVKSVMFAGEGEPLLHPAIASIVKDAKYSKLDVSITTNGTLLTPKFMDNCGQCISWIKVSINAGTPETYAKIHQTKVEDWDKVWKNITYACINKKCVVGVQMVVLPENIDEIEELAITAKLAGVDYVVAKPYSQHLKSITRKYEGLSYKDYLKTLQEMSDKFSDETFSLITRDKTMEALDENTRHYEKCYSTPFMWAYIMATGDVYGCSAYLLDERFKYGNINEQSFSEIWLGERRKKAIDFVEHSLDITECRKNCRMHKVNNYLWDVKSGIPHQNFI